MKYKIQGDPMPVVICELEAGETMITERGSMVWKAYSRTATPHRAAPG